MYLYPEKVCKVLKVLHNNKREGYYDLKLLFPNNTEHRVYLGTELCERINRKELKIKKEETVILTNYHKWYSSKGLTATQFINGVFPKENKHWIVQELYVPAMQPRVVQELYVPAMQPKVVQNLKVSDHNKKRRRLSLKDIVKRTKNIKLEDE